MKNIEYKLDKNQWKIPTLIVLNMNTTKGVIGDFEDQTNGEDGVS